MAKDGMMTISVRVDAAQHKECRRRLVEDDKRFTDLMRTALKKYLSGELAIED